MLIFKVNIQRLSSFFEYNQLNNQSKKLHMPIVLSVEEAMCGFVNSIKLEILSLELGSNEILYLIVLDEISNNYENDKNQ